MNTLKDTHVTYEHSSLHSILFYGGISINETWKLLYFIYKYKLVNESYYKMSNDVCNNTYKAKKRNVCFLWLAILFFLSLLYKILTPSPSTT